MTSNQCPLCQAENLKVIYFGLPGKLCSECSCLSGIASIVPPIANPEGDMVLLAYEGSYLKALWQYVINK